MKPKTEVQVKAKTEVKAKAKAKDLCFAVPFAFAFTITSTFAFAFVLALASASASCPLGRWRCEEVIHLIQWIWRVVRSIPRDCGLGGAVATELARLPFECVQDERPLQLCTCFLA